MGVSGQAGSQGEPHLDKPGAGLPLYQHLLLRFYVGPFVAARSDWDKNWETFDKVNAKIFNTLSGLSREQLETRFLVTPLSGIEDSSRYWSAAMTLEHLIIVGTVVSQGIISLSNGVVPPGKANVADFKPKGGKDGLAQLEEYRSFVEKIRRDVGAVKDKALSSDTKYVHPWFGDFSAKQWQWMLAVHTLSHYRQIKQIADGVKAPQP